MIKEKIAKIISKISDEEIILILNSKDIFKDEILDSFDTLLLIHEIENQFKVKFNLTNNVLDILRTVESISEFINKKR